MATSGAAETVAGPTSGSVVAFEHVTKRYGDGTIAVHDLSLVIEAGEICVLVGPSGCGKTTTMKMVNRLVEPTAGRITIDGRDVMSLPAVELRRGIGYVIQQVGLFPHMTVGANIGVVPSLLGWPKQRIRDRAEELLELIGLQAATYRDKYPAQLSGGERQRVGVARAMAADPPLMLMDEPFGAVDPLRRERLQNEFLRLQRQIRKTIIFVTHDIDEAIKMADRVAILEHGGRLAQFGPPDEILSRPANEFVAKFVGADRGLKRLSLTRVGDVSLIPPVTIRAGEERSSARAELGGSAWALLVDDGRRPIGWIGAGDLAGEGIVDADAAVAGAPLLEPESTLRDALSSLLGSSVELGAVVNGAGEVIGLISVEAISATLRSAGIDGSPGTPRSA